MGLDAKFDLSPRARYDRGTYGLYVLHFAGPLLDGWINRVNASGAIPVQATPFNAWLIGATPQTAEELKELPFVQWLEPFHPFLKARPTTSELELPVAVEFAGIPGAATARERVRNLMRAGSDATKTYGAGYVAGTFAVSDLDQLLREPAVVGVFVRPVNQLSEERQAMSVTSNVETNPSGNLVPTNPMGFGSWLQSRLPGYDTLDADNFRIGIADSGIDYGKFSSTHHEDFRPFSRVRYGEVFLSPAGTIPNCSTTAGEACEDAAQCNTEGSTCPVTDFQVCATCDLNYHGTFIAGLLVGNAPLNLRRRDDEPGGGTGDGYYLGVGLIPTAGILSTKMMNSASRSSNRWTVFNWAKDATSNSVYIQNFSANEYAVNSNESKAGWYSLQARQFDLAVRGLDGAQQQTGPQVTITVSAGNAYADAGATMLTLSPASAKNVITVGATEGVRADVTTTCVPSWHIASSDTFRNIWNYSAHGTNVTSGGQAWNTYIKPDLMAPATQIVSTHSPFRSRLSCEAYPDEAGYPTYIIQTGTSFSAPVAAAGSLIAARVYADAQGGTPNPAAATPALRKAMLIAAARSMRGGRNYAVERRPAALPEYWEPISAAPNVHQGFGRISIEDIVSSTPAKQYINETITLTPTNSKWSATYPVGDPDPTKPVKIALAWTDPPEMGDIATGSDTVGTLLINDLDLHVMIGDGATCREYYGNNLAAPNPDLDLNRPEESVLYPCNQGNIDTKNVVEKVLFYPQRDGVAQFTVLVDATRFNSVTQPAGSQNFALYIFNAGAAMSLPAPGGLTATATGTTSVSLTWQGVQGSAHYEIWRATGTGAFTLVRTKQSLSDVDSGLEANKFYVYKIRAVDADGNAGAYSALELASTASTLFTDDPLVAQVTSVKAVHITELRQRINELRAATGLSAFGYSTTITPFVSVIAAADINELRAALNPARTLLGLPSVSYTDDPIAAGTTVVRTSHVDQLRSGTR